MRDNFYVYVNSCKLTRIICKLANVLTFNGQIFQLLLNKYYKCPLNLNGFDNFIQHNMRLSLQRH
jgi:hypothetical protein